MTEKLLIKRELLERLACEVIPKTHQEMLDASEDFGAAIKELRAILAAPSQPEGEGLEVVDKIGTFEIPDIVATFDGLYLIPVKPLNAGDHLMAISQHRRMWQDAQRAIAELREELDAAKEILAQQGWRNTELRAERDTLRQQLAELREEISNLHTTMMAAAVEIQEHWQSHCDEDGYGPANLMHRLERGIASQYGYTAQTLVQLEAERDTLRQQLAERDAQIAGMRAEVTQFIDTNWRPVAEQRDKLADLLDEVKSDLSAAMNWGDLDRIAVRIDAALAEVKP